ncbi:MAG: hypothetical protein WCR72_17630 [Bacteroidota bacterium]
MPGKNVCYPGLSILSAALCADISASLRLNAKDFFVNQDEEVLSLPYSNVQQDACEVVTLLPAFRQINIKSKYHEYF